MFCGDFGSRASASRLTKSKTASGDNTKRIKIYESSSSRQKRHKIMSQLSTNTRERACPSQTCEKRLVNNTLNRKTLYVNGRPRQLSQNVERKRCSSEISLERRDEPSSLHTGRTAQNDVFSFPDMEHQAKKQEMSHAEQSALRTITRMLQENSHLRERLRCLNDTMQR